MKASVLASTPLAGPGETVEVTFKAPTAAGEYTFLCSFPGHFLSGMKGALTVK
jgi:azurin